MGTVYEELDEAKAELEKLREDYRIKLQLSESLKRSHSEQLSKFQEASLKIEKLSEELNIKDGDLCVAKQMHEELESKLKEKEDAIRHLASANDKLRADCKEKLQSCEEESRGMALALDEASGKNLDQEQQIRLLKEEVEGLRRIVSASNLKNAEGDRKAKGVRDVKRREDDELAKLEEDKSKYVNQLKWKKEQFGHLEEAHQKLRHQFQVSEKEWEKERASLFDEISRLQTNLDSQTRLSESLQNRLQMCNEALAREESKRKYVEVQLSEARSQFDNVFAEYEEAKSTIDGLTGQRDKEIASLRNTLGTKESFYKEMEYQVRMLKQENQDLMASLREFQEAQIQEGGGSYSSLTKLRNKLKGLEQVHRDCSARLKSKEAEWNTQSEALVEKLSCCSSELDSQNALVDQLKAEAQAQDSLIMQQALNNEEAGLVILLLKSGISEAKMKLADAYAEFEHKSKECEATQSHFRALQGLHKDCSARLKSKEAEWTCQTETLMEKLNSCRSELEGRAARVGRDRMEADAHDDLVERLVLNDEEAAVMFLVLKAALTEAQMKLADAYSELDEKSKVSEESLCLCRDLEQLHKNCLPRLKLKEAEWNTQLKTLMEKLKCCGSELDVKNALISQMKMEAEARDSLIEQLALHDEESSLLLLALKSEFKQAYLKFADAFAELEEQNAEINENISELQSQVEMKNTALVKAHLDTEEQQKKVSELAIKVESVHFIEEQQLLQQKELQRLEMKLSESNACQSELKQQLQRMKAEVKEVRDDLSLANEELDEQICKRIEAELGVHLWRCFVEQLTVNLEGSREIHSGLKSDLRKARRKLDRANQELGDKFCEVNRADFELQLWKSIAENLRANLEETHHIRSEVEASLLEEVALEVNLILEKEGLLNQLEEKDRIVKDLNEEITQLNHKLESEQRTAMRRSVDAEQEEEWMKREVEERDHRIEHLQQLVKSLEEEFEGSTDSFSSSLCGMQLEMTTFREAWHKITTSLFLKEIEVEERNLIILELENDLVGLEACLQASRSEVHEFRGKLDQEVSRSAGLIKKLRDENGMMAADVMNLSSERENLLATLGGLSDRMNKLSMEDVQLMENLRSIIQSSDSEEEEKFESLKENTNKLYSSPGTKKAEATTTDARLPFRALNT